MRTLALSLFVFVMTTFCTLTYAAEKVVMCHKDKNTIEVSINAINAHFSHGDVTGECGGGDEDEDDPETLDIDGDGYTLGDGDCNDSDANVNPGADENTDDGIDNDCDGLIDEDDTETLDSDADGFTPEDGDCNDSDESVNPDAEEIIGDGIDNDCDDLIDEDDTDTLDSDADGFTPFQGDCDDADASVNPDAEENTDDGIDNNCNGEIDETSDDEELDGLRHIVDDLLDRLDIIEARLFTVDTDEDGFSPEELDCNDSDNAVFPGADEIDGDGIDSNCDGEDDNT